MQTTLVADPVLASSAGAAAASAPQTRPASVSSNATKEATAEGHGVAGDRQPAAGDSERLKAFDSTVASLQEEVRGLRTVVSLQQAVLAELLETKGTVGTAQELPGLVDQAVETAVAKRLRTIERSMALGLDALGERIDSLARATADEPDAGPIAALVSQRRASSRPPSKATEPREATADEMPGQRVSLPRHPSTPPGGRQ